MAFRNRSHSLLSTLITGVLVAATASGCASATASESSESRAPAVSVQLFPSDHLDEEGPSPLPIVRDCDDERIDVALSDGDDDRCAQEITVAAATAFLYVGSGSAQNQGQSPGMSVATVDPAYALEDALDDAEFQRMLRRADAAPRDGLLERHEAIELERRVAKYVEGR
jgi:hypothetical protein